MIVRVFCVLSGFFVGVYFGSWSSTKMLEKTMAINQDNMEIATQKIGDLVNAFNASCKASQEEIIQNLNECTTDKNSLEKLCLVKPE